jgi:hypothetical protein
MRGFSFEKDTLLAGRALSHKRYPEKKDGNLLCYIVKCGYICSL